MRIDRIVRRGSLKKKIAAARRVVDFQAEMLRSLQSIVTVLREQIREPEEPETQDEPNSH